jgi:hypothetical protein
MKEIKQDSLGKWQRTHQGFSVTPSGTL